ncbi:hypothetical protein L3X38_023650 [Prunus dulcis]|uniref:Uncharacterized protein n=1 Tax=Prunus dulcis TaxID=3755 RepID=A0AAD4Z5R6_PRUDU|nr:hypothetical protein L3X38_023650 [Prunus dulcis]
MLLHFGSVPVLVVSSDKTAGQIMKTHDITFANTPKNTFFKKFCYNFKDVASAPYGEYWRQMKSICVLNLLSNTRVRSFRGVREEETKSMIDNITKHCSSSPYSISSAVNLSEMLETLTNDVRVALGRKYSDGPERGRTFKKLAGELTLVMSRIARLNGLDAKFDDLAKRFDEFLEIVVQEHMDEFRGLTKNEDQKYLADVLLCLQADSPIDRVSIKAIILDVFVGGTDTSLHSKSGQCPSF